MENSGFQKIDFSSQPISTNSTSKNINPVKKKRSFFKSTPFKIIIALLVLIIISSVFFGIKAQAIYKDAKKAYTQAKVAYDAVKKQNVILARDELVKTKDDLEVIKKDLNSISFIKYIPLAGAYYSDAQHLINASSYSLSSAIVATDALIPYADVLGLKGEKSFTQGSAQDRIRLTVKTMGKVVPKIDEIEGQMILAKKEIDSVDPNRYPNFWLFKKAREKIIQIRTLTDEGVIAVEQGKPLIKFLPTMLGESKGQKYLILFQNDKELRPTGGFLTFYSIFRIEEGIFHVDSSSDIYNLDNSIGSHPKAPEIISKYLPKVNSFYIRDSNLSPDFVKSMETFNEFYKKSSQKQDIDGIIALDTQFLVHILDILGDVKAAGTTFNSKIDPRCNCPQVVYVLEENTSKPVNYVKENRKAILGELLYAIMEKSLSSSPKLYWGRLMQQALRDSQEKHILYYIYDKEAQKGVEALNWAGRIKPFEGDYLHINDANFGGQKSNMFVKQSVKMEYSIKNGEIAKTVTISYKNPQPYSDCDLESGGLCLNAILRNFQRIYVPIGSTLVDSKGSEVKVETKEDLGKTFFEAFMTVKPLGKAEIIYTYKLPFKLNAGSTLPVLIQKQPGIESIPYEIYVNGAKVQSFNLVSDKEITLNP